MSESIEVSEDPQLKGMPLSEYIKIFVFMAIALGVLFTVITLLVFHIKKADENNLANLTECEYKSAKETTDNGKIISIGDLYAWQFLCFINDKDEAILDKQRNALKRPSPQSNLLSH